MDFSHDPASRLDFDEGDWTVCINSRYMIYWTWLHGHQLIGTCKSVVCVNESRFTRENVRRPLSVVKIRLVFWRRRSFLEYERTFELEQKANLCLDAKEMKRNHRRRRIATMLFGVPCRTCSFSQNCLRCCFLFAADRHRCSCRRHYPCKCHLEE